MTDNRTTELREKLTERGIKYRTTEVRGMPVTLYDSSGRTWSVTDHPNGYMVVNCGNLTPEQAIAATLGGGTLTAEQVREAIFNGSTYASYDGVQYYANGIGMQAIADELNAVLENGTYIALPTDAAGEPIHVGDVLESTNAFKNWCVVMGIGAATKHDHIIYVKFEAAGGISQTWASKFIHRKPDAERGERKAVKR